MTPRRERVDTVRGRALVAEYRKVAWETRVYAPIAAELDRRRRRVLGIVRNGPVTAAAAPIDSFDSASWGDYVDSAGYEAASGVYAEISATGYQMFSPIDSRGLLSPVDTTEHLRSLTGRMVGVGDDTARAIGSTLEAGFNAGKSYADMAIDVQDVFGASDSRALMIARTEITRGVEDINGDYAAVLDGSGSDAAGNTITMTKQWLPTGDACPTCSDLGTAGALLLDDCWDDGCQPPDPHPNCRCSLGYDTLDRQPVGS